MIDEANLDQIWIPEGVRPFAVGDHVRVHLSGECQTVLYEDHSGKPFVHAPEEDGQIGEITDINPDIDGGHTHYVLYAQPVWANKSFWTGSDFAPHELELITS